MLKHWPGHGKVSNMLPNTNLDQNFHLLEEPLNVDINLSTQQDIYKDLLNDEIIRNFTAVMTSHLKVEDFKNICTQGSELMMITYCKKAIDKIRKCYNFENGVIISDDISYLKATYKKSLYDSIIDTFKSGHDMVTIASLVPYYYTPEYNSIEKKKCSENYNLRIGMNNFRKTFERLVIYYSDDDKRCELKKSVERIIRWKRNINILRKIHGSGELANDAMKEINSLLEVEKKDYSLKKNDYIFDYLNKNYEYISKNSMILISPRDINTDDFSQYLGIERVSSKILAIGPTLNTNDMKLYLEKENFRNVINVDLSYRDSDLEDPEKFIKKYTEYIKLLIRKQAPDYFIYGLVNKPSHLQIWKNIRSYIKDNNCKIKILLIVFHAPSILNSDDFEKDDFVISTFSNQKYPNKIIVELINGNDSINLKDPSYLPVAIPPIYPDVLENIQTQDYSLISDGFNTLKKKYDEYNQSLIIDNNENEYIKTNTLDLSPSAGVGNLKNNNKVIHKNKPNTMLFYAQYYLAPLSGFLIAISIFYSLKLDTKLTIICFVASIFIYISMYDFMIEVLSNKIESEDLMKRSQNPGVRAGSAFLSPFILYWIIQKIGFIFAVKKSVN